MCKNNVIVAFFLVFIFGGIIGALTENRYMEPKIEYIEVVKIDTVVVVNKNLIKENNRLKRQAKEDNRQIKFLQKNYEKAVEMMK